MSSECRTRLPRGRTGPIAVVDDPEVVGAHLEDAAHYPGGHAAGIAYPRTEAEISTLVRTHRRVLPIGAQSSLTGGATPFGDVLISTARMNRILEIGGGRATAEAGVTLATLEEAALRVAGGAAYPPRPTFTGASAGGCVATNAAGAATFKYGSTREWVEGLTVILANGEALDLTRGACRASAEGFLIRTRDGEIHIRVPSYHMPDVAKRSAGYFAAPGMDLIDLFIGSEGTLGLITTVTVRLLSPAPATALALVMCPSEEVGLQLVATLRQQSAETWRAQDPAGIDVCAIEHVDDRSLAIVQQSGATASLNVTIPNGTAAALLIQMELPPGARANAAYEQIAGALSHDALDGPLVRFCRLVEQHRLTELTEFAAPGDDRRATELMGFREAVPTVVNQRVGTAKRTIDERIEKTAADMVVPFEHFAEMMDVYRAGFESRGLDYAIWGHISDGNVHPNVIPRSYADVVLGKAAILEFGRAITDLGGCPLAEHGVGRNPVKQALLRQLYGDGGIQQMRAVKRALDPEWKLAPGVIFDVEGRR